MSPDDLSALARAARAAAGRLGPECVTPLLASAAIGPERGVDLRFKAENFQRTGSFKFRGALNRLMILTPDEARRGVVTASSGNHGIACAEAARRCGSPLTVVLPETVAPNKWARIAGQGAEIVLFGSESGAAERHARALAQARGLPYVSPYNDPDVMAGQGTIGVELLSQCPDLDCVFVALGGGGLVGGIGAVLKAARPAIRIVGVSAANSPALAVALEEGRIRPVTHLDTLADGVSGDMDEGSITFPVCRIVIDEVVTCSEAEIAVAFRRMAYEEHQIVEGAAALAVAGFLKRADELRGRCAVVVVCGANIAPEKVRALLAAP